MVDFLGEIGTLDPWLWRGWAYLISPAYRAKRHAQWAEKGHLYAVADVVFSLAVMAFETLLVFVVIQLALGVFSGRP